MTNFDRQYRFAAGEAGGKAFEIGEPGGETNMPLHIQFEIEKTDLETPNTGKISIWNLSQEHISELEKTNCIATLNAGYGSTRPPRRHGPMPKQTVRPPKAPEQRQRQSASLPRTLVPKPKLLVNPQKKAV